MSATEPRYVPAAGRRAFTRLYDPVLAHTMRERSFRSRLLRQLLADLPQPGGAVVDIGCGTGTFAISTAAAAPAAKVTPSTAIPTYSPSHGRSRAPPPLPG